MIGETLLQGLAAHGRERAAAVPATVRMASRDWSDAPVEELEWTIGLHADTRADAQRRHHGPLAGPGPAEPR